MLAGLILMASCSCQKIPEDVLDTRPSPRATVADRESDFSEVQGSEFLEELTKRFEAEVNATENGYLQTRTLLEEPLSLIHI